MIDRILENIILDKLSDNKVLLILGARQVGKTTILKKMFSEMDDLLWLNADEPDVRDIFKERTSTFYKEKFRSYKYLIIDEAQRIKDIGLSLKLIHDNVQDLKVIATGSSAFELSSQVQEPLTGRKWVLNLFSLSIKELLKKNGELNEKRLLDNRLIYGCYPDVINNPSNEREILSELSDSYLFKDILMWQSLKRPDLLFDLLRLLAFQVGSQVSNNELSRSLGIDVKTVDRYIELLIKSFIIFRLNSYSKNHRKELKKSKKIYFYDNGILNSIKSNFKPLQAREDIGALWENYIISEMVKDHSYSRDYSNLFFWRTKDRQEIDLIKEKDGKLNSYEIKWNPKKNIKIPSGFLNSYPDAQHHVISNNNYLEYFSEDRGAEGKG